MNNFNVGDRVYLPGENLHGVVGSVDRKVSLSILLDDGRTIGRWDYYAIPEPPQYKELLEQALSIDGARHKQWYLWQIAEALHIELPDDIADKGIAP
jgi:hypothetical protein